MTIWTAVDFVAVLALGPLLKGVATRTKSLLTGRRGAPVLQLYRDLARLWQKGAVYSTTTTWIFRVAPVAAIVTTLAAAALIPFDGREAMVQFAGDFVAFAGVLGLGRFLLILAALDTGLSFEGMGASRDATFAALVEPALFTSFVALALATGERSLGGMLGSGTASAWAHAAPSLAMVAVSFFFVLLAESSRVPVDDPATHLELTMIHEVAILDHSGPDLALLEYGGALRFAVFAALPIGVLAVRATVPPLAGLGVLVLGSLGVAVLAGVVESSMARLRLSRVPQFLAAATVLAALGVILQVLA